MLYSLVILCFAVGCIVDATPWERPPNFKNGNVVRGPNAPDGQYPYHASLQLLGGSYCSGSIISSQWILTAAHCVYTYPAFAYTIYVGANKLSGTGKKYQVLEIYYHEDYDHNENIKNDVALLRVEPITFNDKVQPIVLDSQEIVGEVSCVLSGWGIFKYPGTFPDDLQHVELTTTTAQLCQSKHEDPVIESEICTITKEEHWTCTADGGAPLARNVNGVNKQIGIVSWVMSCDNDHPDVFTRVSTFIPWIKEKCNNCV